MKKIFFVLFLFVFAACSFQGASSPENLGLSDRDVEVITSKVVEQGGLQDKGDRIQLEVSDVQGEEAFGRFYERYSDTSVDKSVLGVWLSIGSGDDRNVIVGSDSYFSCDELGAKNVAIGFVEKCRSGAGEIVYRDDEKQKQAEVSEQTQKEDAVRAMKLAWDKFRGEVLDISFDGMQSLDIESFSQDGDRFDVVFDSGENSFYLTGVNDKYVDEGFPSFCLGRKVTMADFVGNGGEKVADNVAVDFAATNFGDASYAGYVFTDLSKEYPYICFDFGMNGALDRAAEVDPTISSYLDAASNQYDVEGMIREGKLGGELLNRLKFVEEFANSIKKK